MELDKTKHLDAISKINSELRRARQRFPNMRNPHEGYAILLEEVDELWDAIKKTKPLDMGPEGCLRDPGKCCCANCNNWAKAHDEAVQVAAMAIRMLEDVFL